MKKAIAEETGARRRRSVQIPSATSQFNSPSTIGQFKLENDQIETFVTKITPSTYSGTNDTIFNNPSAIGQFKLKEKPWLKCALFGTNNTVFYPIIYIQSEWICIEETRTIPSFTKSQLYKPNRDRKLEQSNLAKANKNSKHIWSTVPISHGYTYINKQS